MVPRVLFLAAALFVLVGVPTASAQLAVLAEGPAEPAQLLVGTGAPANVTVKMQSTGQSQFICGQTSSVTVALTVGAQAPELGFNATISPSSLSFTIPQGAYIGGVTGQWNPDAQTALLRIELGNNVPNGHGEHVFTVLAEYAAATPPAGCQTPGTWGGASDEADVPVVPRFPPGATGSPAPGTGAGGGATSPTPGTKESPAPAPLLGALVLVAFLVRRRV